MVASVPVEVRNAVGAYLTAADRLLPGAVVGLAAGGSIALGAYRPGSSDIDLLATIDESWRERPDLIRRIRLLHLSQVPRLLARALRGQGFSACCNTSFVWASDTSLPVTQIRPIASHVGEIFQPRGAFDVNPVMWHQLTRGGVALRGDDMSAWALNPQPETLRAWTRENLNEYWGRLTARLARGRGPLRAGRVAWCVLGPARMHATLATGEIISKHDAAQYALDAFPAHTQIVRVALAGLHGDTAPSEPPRREWRGRTVEFMREVIGDAHGSED